MNTPLVNVIEFWNFQLQLQCKIFKYNSNYFDFKIFSYKYNYTVIVINYSITQLCG